VHDDGQLAGNRHVSLFHRPAPCNPGSPCFLGACLHRAAHQYRRRLVQAAAGERVATFGDPSVQATAGMPSNLIAIQQDVISAWGSVLRWEQNNGVFNQATHPPTAQAVLDVGVELTLVMYYTEYTLYLVNANNYQVLPKVLNTEMKFLNNTYISEQGNLPYVAPVGTF
jgi:hypothetical protein